jgi:hypothetical protein
MATLTGSDDLQGAEFTAAIAASRYLSRSCATASEGGSGRAATSYESAVTRGRACTLAVPSRCSTL